MYLQKEGNQKLFKVHICRAEFLLSYLNLTKHNMSANHDKIQIEIIKHVSDSQKIKLKSKRLRENRRTKTKGYSYPKKSH